jgi:uncharacterized protein (UPF0332 family)
MSRTLEDYSNYRISKSAEAFDDAKLLLENNRFNSSINRLYYSSYYLVSVLVNSLGIKTETHNGLKVQFNMHFIKSNKIDSKYGKLYTKLFSWRQESDYSDFIDFNEEEVKLIFDQVKEFSLVLINLIES